MNKFIDYLGYKILDQDYAEARKSFSEGSVLTISPNSYGVATINEGLNSALKRDGLLVLDGVYFGLGYFLRNFKTIRKNQGPEIFYQELEIQKNQKGKEPCNIFVVEAPRGAVHGTSESSQILSWPHEATC